MHRLRRHDSQVSFYGYVWVGSAPSRLLLVSVAIMMMSALLISHNEFSLFLLVNFSSFVSHLLFSSAKLDACGVCGGNNATCTGCDGVPNSGKVVDSCGTCGGSDQTCPSTYAIAPVSPISSSGFCPGSLTSWSWIVRPSFTALQPCSCIK